LPADAPVVVAGIGAHVVKEIAQRIGHGYARLRRTSRCGAAGPRRRIAMRPRGGPCPHELVSQYTLTRMANAYMIAIMRQTAIVAAQDFVREEACRYIEYRKSSTVALASLLLAGVSAFAQQPADPTRNLTPVTDAILRNPPASDC